MWLYHVATSEKYIIELYHVTVSSLYYVALLRYYVSISQRSNTNCYVTSGLSKPWSLNQFKSFRARRSYENDAEHVPANRISRRQNLCITVTSLPTHTQRKKLKFSETALSFAVKVKLSPFVCIFFVKLSRELRTRRAFDRCERQHRYKKTCYLVMHLRHVTTSCISMSFHCCDCDVDVFQYLVSWLQHAHLKSEVVIKMSLITL